tara:strand:+ start:379 stop:2358 length:1980 start_codon:yes stop_codon:yes gene_type:complete
MEVDEDVPFFFWLNDDEVRHVLHAIDRWQRDVVFLALVCTRLRDALRRILPNQELCTSIAGAFGCDARVQMCRMDWRSFKLGRCLGEDAAPLNLERPLQPDRMSMEALWYYIKCASAKLIVRSYFDPFGVGWPRLDIDAEWLLRAPNRALLMFVAAHGRVDVLKRLVRKDDGRFFLARRSWRALLDSPLFACSTLSRAFATDVSKYMNSDPGSEMAKHIANCNQAFLDLQHLLLRPALCHKQLGVLQWVETTMLNIGQLHQIIIPNQDHVSFCGVRVIAWGGFNHPHRWRCDRPCLKTLVADAAYAGVIEPFAKAFDQIFGLWHNNENPVTWLASFLWSLLTWIFVSGFGRGNLVKYIVERCEHEAPTIRAMFGLRGPVSGFDLEDLVGTIPPGVPQRDMLLRDQVVQWAILPGDQEYTEWLFYELYERPDRGFLTRTAAGRRFSFAHSKHIRDEEEGAACRQLAHLGSQRRPPPLRLSGAPHRFYYQATPPLGGNYEGDPMVFAYTAAIYARPSADAPSHVEAGAVVVVERWLRYELECDDGIHFDVQTWMEALRWLRVAGPPLLERVCKEYVHSTHAPKLESMGWLILRYWTHAVKKPWYSTAWDPIMRAYIRMGLRNGLFSAERVSACIAGDGIFHHPYWATQPVQECLDEWCTTH